MTWSDDYVIIATGYLIYRWSLFIYDWLDLIWQFHSKEKLITFKWAHVGYIPNNRITFLFNHLFESLTNSWRTNDQISVQSPDITSLKCIYIAITFEKLSNSIMSKWMSIVNSSHRQTIAAYLWYMFTPMYTVHITSFMNDQTRHGNPNLPLSWL